MARRPSTARVVGWLLRVSALVLLVYVGLLGPDLARLHAPSRGLHPGAGQGLPARQRPAARRRLPGAHRRGDAPGRGDRPRRRRASRHTVAMPGQSFVLNATNARTSAPCSSCSSRSTSALRSRTLGERDRSPSSATRFRRGAGGRRRRLRRAAGRRPGHRRRLQAAWSRTAATSASRRCRARPTTSSAPGNQQPGLVGLFNELPRHARRSSTSTSTAPRPRRWASRSTTCSTRCRSTSARLLRQRLQPLRPHLAGERPGRRGLPHAARGRRQLKVRNARRRDGPAGHAGRRCATPPARSSSPATTCSRRRRSTAAARRASAPAQAIAIMERLAERGAAAGDGRTSGPSWRCSRSSTGNDRAIVRVHRWVSCWSSWCWPASTRAGRCRWR